jgi:hypothetical protein
MAEQTTTQAATDGGRVYLVDKITGKMVPMVETPYVREDVLQELLANHHDLLAGEQINPETPRKWLLVAREFGVPKEVDGASNWSLDHLFIDQDGTPTFVECKRSQDTRARREVVAQMLDYAANGTAYWPLERLRRVSAETAMAHGDSVDDKVRSLLGPDSDDVDVFWEKVEANLRAGRVRLIFVADKTTRELRRLIEFLNEKMSDVEVLAVEVKQYLADDGQRVMVPRAIGLTEAARDSKPTQGRRTSLEEMLAKSEPAAAEFFHFVLKEAARRSREGRSHEVRWGMSGFSVGVIIEGGRRVTYAYCYPPSRFEFYLEYLSRYGLLSPDRETEIRESLRIADVLVDAGKFTLKASPSPDNLETLQAGFVRIADTIDGLTR